MAYSCERICHRSGFAAADDGEYCKSEKQWFQIFLLFMFFISEKQRDRTESTRILKAPASPLGLPAKSLETETRLFHLQLCVVRILEHKGWPCQSI